MDDGEEYRKSRWDENKNEHICSFLQQMLFEEFYVQHCGMKQQALALQALILRGQQKGNRETWVRAKKGKSCVLWEPNGVGEP